MLHAAPKPNSMWAQLAFRGCARQLTGQLACSCLSRFRPVHCQHSASTASGGFLWFPRRRQQARQQHTAAFAAMAEAGALQAASPRVAVGQMTATGSQEHNFATNEALCKAGPQLRVWGVGSEPCCC